MAKNNASKKNAIHFQVPTDVKKTFIEYCEKNDITLSQLGRRAMSLYVTLEKTNLMELNFQPIKPTTGAEANGKRNKD